MVVVAPHPDDEVLGAGGLILRAADAGWNVHVLYMTVAGFSSIASGKQSTTDDRDREISRASTVLGLTRSDVLFRGQKFLRRLDTVPQTELIAFIETGIARTKPSVFVMPAQGHHHQDHRATAAACLAALRPAPAGSRPFVPIILAYSHSESGFGSATHLTHTNAFVDITGVMDRKLEALACYESQLCKPPHPRSLEGVRSLSAASGAYGGTEYAEEYECIRFVI